jgi:hypothetical protein
VLHVGIVGQHERQGLSTFLVLAKPDGLEALKDEAGPLPNSPFEDEDGKYEQLAMLCMGGASTIPHHRYWRGHQSCGAVSTM